MEAVFWLRRLSHIEPAPRARLVYHAGRGSQKRFEILEKQRSTGGCPKYVNFVGHHAGKSAHCRILHSFGSGPSGTVLAGGWSRRRCRIERSDVG